MILIKRIAAIAFLLALCRDDVFGGDAVVIGFTADGTWTSVTYYCSSTPKGGEDYKSKADARAEALRDLKKRGGPYTVRTSLLAESDRTGYAAVGRAATAGGKDVNVVGYGESQHAADDCAIDQLNRAGATLKQQIVYRYFSYGAEGPGAAGMMTE